MTAKYRDAPPGRRIAAKITDVVFAFFASSVFSVLAVPFRVWSPVLSVLISICSVLFLFAYLLFADAWSGRSVGKRIFGLKVVDYQSGGPCSFFQSFIRNIAGLGFLRILQITEEEELMESGQYKGTVVIDVSEPKAQPPSLPSDSPEPPRPSRLDLEGIAEYAKRKKSGDS